MRSLHKSGVRIALLAVTIPTAVAVATPLAVAQTTSSPSACPRNELDVIATDAGFRLHGTLSSGPATIRFTNASHSPHALDLYRLTPGVTVDKVLNDVRSGDWAAFAGDLADGGPGNGTPNIISPGRSAVTVGDGLHEGMYAVMDGTPGLNGIPNFLQGYAAPLTVNTASVPARAPVSDGDVLITDTQVQLPAAITTGHGTFEIHYDGEHELQLLRLEPGVTVRQAFDYWLARFSGQDPGGTPPAEFVGGLADLRSGVRGWVELDLPPGRYGVWSIEDGDFTDIDNGLTATFIVRRHDSTRH